MPISISCILANPEAYSLTCLIRQVVWCTGTHFHFNTRFQSPNNLFVKLLNCRQYLWLTEVSGMFQNNLIWQFNFTLKNTLLFEFAQDSYRQKSVTACHTYRKIRICKKKKFKILTQRAVRGIPSLSSSSGSSMPSLTASSLLSSAMMGKGSWLSAALLNAITSCTEDVTSDLTLSQ